MRDLQLFQSNFDQQGFNEKKWFFHTNFQPAVTFAILGVERSYMAQNNGLGLKKRFPQKK